MPYMHMYALSDMHTCTGYTCLTVFRVLQHDIMPIDWRCSTTVACSACDAGAIQPLPQLLCIRIQYVFLGMGHHEIAW
jgi:hypothetical protein